MDFLVQTPRRNDQAAGDRQRIHRQRFEQLSNEITITKACESAGFMRRGHRDVLQTIHDVDDGFEGRTGACREYTLPFARKPIRTISGFFGINWQIRIRFLSLRKFFFEAIQIFGVFKVQSHTMWPCMCMCCGLFVPTQFHFECCGVRDDMYSYIVQIFIDIEICERIRICICICICICIFICTSICIYSVILKVV